MSDEDQGVQDYLVSAPRSEKSMQATEVVASALAVLWVGAVVAYVLTAPKDTGALGMVLTLLVVFLPLALIWAAITTLRSVRVLRNESQRLQATVEAMRAAYVLGLQAPGTQPSVERKLDALAKQTETALASFSSRRDAGLTLASANRRAVQLPPEAQGDAEQPALALGTPADVLQPRLGVADFTRALQFPESPDDKEGFRALRLALEDRNVAKLIRASQDVLTLLSQEGIYMDDLKPDRSRPELWRKFAGGERGRAIAGLGGVRDRSSLALTSGRMREDPVFRDAAHHFLRTFDRCFAEFEPLASDADLADLADTRTARAFMLLGRVTGTFD
ncbi:hypothetical protein [Cypionkella sp.]|jgi:hypothetical protein|uniref:hypothetical protein n=1 Tax=Cypionkella sp. TaxID=2811411 RepID=UPI0037536526